MKKNKIDKDNSGKKKQKKSLKNEKKTMWRNIVDFCSNPQCFKEKKLQSHIKKIKSKKIILKKKHKKLKKKRKKNTWGKLKINSKPAQY
jgi:hypothetical protein